jgi:5,10-methylenetetrahydrofolate reductase
MSEFKITIEKQRNWGREDMEKMGVDGFSITDIPFSSVAQAPWFLAAFFIDLLLNLFGFFVHGGAAKPPRHLALEKYWQDTDSYFFYKNTMGKKSRPEFLKIFWKMLKRLLDHHDTFAEMSYTPNPIATVAANGKFQRNLKNKIDQIIKEKKLAGIFLVSGGGVLQRFFRKIFPFNLILNSSYTLLKYTKEKFPQIKIYSAYNPNLATENIKSLIKKQKYTDIFLSQPPFLWKSFIKKLEEINQNQETRNIKIRVGVPIFTNPWNVRFWIQLVFLNWRKDKETVDLVRLFEEKYFQDESEGKQNFKEFSKQWALNFIYRIQNLQKEFPQITGIHIMPMGNSISIEEILVAFEEKMQLKENFSTVNYPTKIKYENIKYKNHFYELDEHLKEEDKVYLEKEFVPQHQSIIWYFNKIFWDHLDPFMRTLGKDYKKSIGGTADSNTLLTQYSVKEFAQQIKKTKLVNPTYVELGAASCAWAKEFITEFKNEPTNENFVYVFYDFSLEVLARTKQEMGENFLGIQIEYICSDQPIPGDILRIHATNIYDNLPYDRYVLDHKNLFEVYLKTYISKENLEQLLEKFTDNSVTRKRIFNLVSNFSYKTKKYLNSVETFLIELRKILPESNFYNFWQDFWNAIKFEEKNIPHVKNQRIEKLFKHLENEKIEFSYSTEAERDILKKINLLAKGGTLEIIDIVTTKVEDYKNFLGPVKYDASLANYLNGPLLQETLSEKYPNLHTKTQSLKDFGGKRNQTILEITKL